jgi:hypothetical protein
MGKVKTKSRSLTGGRTAKEKSSRVVTRWSKFLAAVQAGQIDWPRYPRRAPSAVSAIFPDRLAVLNAFCAEMAAEVEAAIPVAERNGAWREQWFAVLMAHVDAMQAQQSFLRMLRADPPSLPLLWRAFAAHAVALTAPLPQPSPERGGQLVQLCLLGVLYPWLISVWLRDESPDSQPTMAALDRVLQKIESVAEFMHAKKEKPAHKSFPTAVIKE